MPQRLCHLLINAHNIDFMGDGIVNMNVHYYYSEVNTNSNTFSVKLFIARLLLKSYTQSGEHPMQAEASENVSHWSNQANQSEQS